MRSLIFSDNTGEVGFENNREGMVDFFCKSMDVFGVLLLLLSVFSLFAILADEIISILDFDEFGGDCSVFLVSTFAKLIFFLLLQILTKNFRFLNVERK